MRYFLLIIVLTILYSAFFESQDMDAASLSKELDEIIRAYCERDQFSGAVLVAKNGQLLLKRAYGMADVEHAVRNTPATRFRLASLTKMFTAAAILKLYEAGKVDLHVPIARYLPDFRLDITEQVTIHQLLTHSSGLYRDILAGTGHSRHEYYEMDQLLQIISEQDLLFAPGDSISYSNPGFVLLSAIIEKVTHHALEAAIDSLVLEPMDLDDTGIVRDFAIIEDLAEPYMFLVDERFLAPHQNLSFVPGVGDMYSTVDDLYKFSASLHGAFFDNKEIRELMFRAHIGANGYAIISSQYAFGDIKGQVVASGGETYGVASELTVFRDHDVTVVILSNITPIDAQDMTIRLAFDAFGLGKRPPPENRSAQFLRFLIDNDEEEAVARWKELDEQERPGFWTLFRLAQGYLDCHQLYRALHVSRFLTRIHLNQEYAWVILGRCLETSDRDQASKAFSTALEINPNSVSARGGLKRLEDD